MILYEITVLDFFESLVFIFNVINLFIVPLSSNVYVYKMFVISAVTGVYETLCILMKHGSHATQVGEMSADHVSRPARRPRAPRLPPLLMARLPAESRARKPTPRT